MTSLEIEFCAEALFQHRFQKRQGGWELFALNHPDIAAIYRENARVVLDAHEQFESNSRVTDGVSHDGAGVSAGSA